jgi:hypothetical protein
MDEIRFLTWYVAHESDMEEARADIDNRVETLLERVEVRRGDPKVEWIERYLFENYDPTD